ncbi:MAG: asparagine synthetase B, partial [Candidatus Bathyarchaeia archaeon]
SAKVNGMKAIAAVFDRKGENATQIVGSMLAVLGREGADTFGIATKNQVKVTRSLEKLQIEDLKSPTAIGHVFLKVLAQDKPQLKQIGNATFIFDGRIYALRVEPSEAYTVAQKLEKGIDVCAEVLVREFDGCFAFAMAEDGKLIVGRDALGLYPLYYGESGSILAFASERKALWKIGIKRAQSFPPGHLLIADKKGSKMKPVKVLSRSVIASLSIDETVKRLQTLLEQSTIERTHGLDEVAVAFSGGLDSSLIAWLAKKVGVKVHLIHVSLKKQPETERAEKAASQLDVSFYEFLYDEGDVAQTLPKVLLAIEEPNPLTASIGVPIFWAAEKATKLGFRVLFSGQGADEYFGGYKRYLNIYKRFGEEAAEKAMVHDILTMHESNFERDSKICAFNNVELRLPFASFPIAEFALNLPLKMKVESPSDPLRKTVLRRAAERLGLPSEIVYRPKKAVQYATGVAKAVRRLAKREGLRVEQFLQKLFLKVFDEFYRCF